MQFGKIAGKLAAFGMAGALVVGGVMAADAAVAAPVSETPVPLGYEGRFGFDWINIVWTPNTDQVTEKGQSYKDTYFTELTLDNYPRNTTDINKSGLYKLPALGDVGAVSDSSRTVCATRTGGDSPGGIIGKECSDSPDQKWKVKQINGKYVITNPAETGSISSNFSLHTHAASKPEAMTSAFFEANMKKIAAQVDVTGPTGSVEIPRPTITGTGEPGAAITVKDGNGNTLGTTTVGADGKWSITPSKDLPNGTVTVTVEQDSDGVKSTATGSFDVAVIAELTITGPTAGAVLDTDQPIVSGTAEPGAQITITDKNGAQIGTATADQDGNWSTGIGTLPNGTHEITVTDNHGGAKSIGFTIDKAADFADLAVTGPAPGETVDSRTPTVSGTAEPGAEITITDADGTVIGEGIADENGDWAITLPETQDGAQKITITDNHGGSQDVEFIVAAENDGDTPALAGSLAGVMLAGAAGITLLIRRRQHARATA